MCGDRVAAFQRTDCWEQTTLGAVCGKARIGSGASVSAIATCTGFGEHCAEQQAAYDAECDLVGDYPDEQAQQKRRAARERPIHGREDKPALWRFPIANFAAARVRVLLKLGESEEAGLAVLEGSTCCAIGV